MFTLVTLYAASVLLLKWITQVALTLLNGTSMQTQLLRSFGKLVGSGCNSYIRNFDSIPERAKLNKGPWESSRDACSESQGGLGSFKSALDWFGNSNIEFQSRPPPHNDGGTGVLSQLNDLSPAFAENIQFFSLNEFPSISLASDSSFCEPRLVDVSELDHEPVTCSVKK